MKQQRANGPIVSAIKSYKDFFKIKYVTNLFFDQEKAYETAGKYGIT